MSDLGRDGITIPDDVADAAGLPEDLDSSKGDDYRFPSPERRLSAARVYLAAAVIAGAGAVAGLPAGMWWIAAGFLALAGFHVLAAWRTQIDERQAFDTAAGAVSFGVGHGSAALRFEGLLAKPVWSVLVYDAGGAPTRRGLVRVDAASGEVVDAVEEPFDPAAA